MWGGSRIAIVFNGSPLFTGAADSGESKIRRWILENDWLEAIIALPDQLFYNTGISTYFWILTNRKDADHKGKVVLLDARDQWVKMRKSLGDKRKELGDGTNGRPDHIGDITRLYSEALQVAKDPEHRLHGKVKLFTNEDFGYQNRVPVGITTTPTDRTLRSADSGKRIKSDTERGFHRAEYLQQIPQASLTHQLLYPYRADSESVHSQFDLSLWNRRMIAYGVERQRIFVLGFALSQNATSHQIHLQARSSAQQKLRVA